MFEKNVGIDLGYGFVKVSEEDNEFVFPSVVGVSQEVSYFSKLSKYKDRISNLMIGVDGKQYFVGDYAVRQSEIPSRSLDQNRVEDPYATILFLTAMGLLTDKSDKFNVVTGLPPSSYAAYSKQMKESLTKEFTFELLINGIPSEKKIQISDIEVIPQPFGTLYDQILNRNGQIGNHEMADMTVGVVDIGFKTTNFAVSDGPKFIEKLSASSDSGLVSAYNMTASNIRKDFRVDKKDYKLDKVISTRELKIAGKAHDMSDTISSSFGYLAERIKSEIDSLWDFRELDCILLTGGASSPLAECLLPHYNNMTLVDNAQISNSRGFYKLANSISPKTRRIDEE